MIYDCWGTLPVPATESVIVPRRQDGRALAAKGYNLWPSLRARALDDFREVVGVFGVAIPSDCS